MSGTSAFVQLASGLNIFMARPRARVFGPRSFWYTTPSWLTMKVITPETPYCAGKATSEDLLVPPPRIDPPARAVLYERDRKRPVVGADLQHGGGAGGNEPVRRVVRLQELLAALSIGHRIARRDERAALAADDAHQPLGVAAAQRSHERLRRRLGG